MCKRTLPSLVVLICLEIVIFFLILRKISQGVTYYYCFEIEITKQMNFNFNWLVVFALAIISELILNEIGRNVSKWQPLLLLCLLLKLISHLHCKETEFLTTVQF